MRAVFINLDRAAERRAFMERQGRTLGLALERSPAVRADAIPEEEIRRLGRAWERPLTAPEIGCFLSHHALWCEVAAGSEPLLVLEDDVVLSPRLTALLEPIAALDDVEFLNLESFDRRRFVEGGRGRPLGESARILRVHRDKSGSAAYVLWPKGAERLVRRAERGAAPVDAFLHGLTSLRSYQVEPAFGMQLHILAARGLATPLAAASSVQAPRERRPISLADLPFRLRRIGTQVSLAGQHLMRLAGRRYRRIDIDEDEIHGALERSAGERHSPKA